MFINNALCNLKVLSTFTLCYETVTSVRVNSNDEVGQDTVKFIYNQLYHSQISVSLMQGNNVSTLLWFMILFRFLKCPRSSIKWVTKCAKRVTRCWTKAFTTMANTVPCNPLEINGHTLICTDKWGEVRCILQWSLSGHQHVCISYSQEDTKRATKENLKSKKFST